MRDLIPAVLRKRVRRVRYTGPMVKVEINIDDPMVERTPIFLWPGDSAEVQLTNGTILVDYPNS